MAKRQQSGLRYVFGGMFLSGISKTIELRGDVAPYMPEGGSGERLFYHVLALLVLLGAMACFIKGCRVAFRRIVKRAPSETDELVKVFGDSRPPQKDPPEDDSFDPEAALARYFERKQETTVENANPIGVPPRPVAGGFGRKGI